MKVLVTVSSGFIGKNLVTQLTVRGDFDTLSYNRGSTLEGLRLAFFGRSLLTFKNREVFGRQGKREVSFSPHSDAGASRGADFGRQAGNCGDDSGVVS